MEQNKIEVIYKILLNEQKLITANLIEYGLTKEDIEFMVEKKILAPIKKDEFKLVSAEKFRQYGAKLLTANHTTEANKCFKICYDLEPNGRNIAIQYMLSKIIKHKYDEAFEIFSKIENQHQEKYETDNNLYLYLLGNITLCPEEYQDKVRKLKPQDILLPSGPNTKVENEIRMAISKHKFKYAYQLINTRYSKERNYSLKFEVIRILVIQAINIENEQKAKLFNLVKQGQYDEIYSTLAFKKQQIYISDIELAALNITKNIIKLMNFQQIPAPSEIETKDMYEAIKNNDFKLALEINEEFLEYTKQPQKQNIIYLLLTKLNDLITKQEKEYEIYKKEINEESMVQDLNIQNPNIVQEPIDLEYELKNAEELAYYIKEVCIPLEFAKKKMGILPEQLLLIKLIYARDYYIESNYDMGDKFIQEIELSINITPRITNLLQMVKAIKLEPQSSKKLIRKP